MSLEIITKQDLETFRLNLLADIKSLLVNPSPTLNKPWLRGSEVKKMLSISEGSLQQLRVTGKLKASKVGGIYYYRFTDIEKMMNV
jgi:hypothetical protein